jgi:hypothetical protein
MVRGTIPVIMFLMAATGSVGAAPRSDAAFCGRAQQLLTGSTRLPQTVVFEALEDFIKSKPRIVPLEVDQHVTRAGPAALPRRVSCKMKSADHLRAEFGPEAAGVERQCRAVNRDTISRVLASLTPGQRAASAYPPSRIFLEPDADAGNGARFTRGTDSVWEDASGRLRIQALAIRVDWTDWRWRWMPDRFRGQHSCHFVAPEYLRAVLLGTVRVEKASAGS